VLDAPRTTKKNIGEGEERGVVGKEGKGRASSEKGCLFQLFQGTGGKRREFGEKKGWANSEC